MLFLSLIINMFIFLLLILFHVYHVYFAPLCVRDGLFEGYDFYEAKNKISSLKFKEVCSSLSEFFLLSISI